MPTAKKFRAVKTIGAGIFLFAAGWAVFPVHAADTNQPAGQNLTIDRVTVDGEAANLDAGALNGVLQLSPGAHRIAFYYGPTENATDQPWRLRHKLEGVDDDWQEAGGAMRFTVRLNDAKNDPISFRDFAATGDSQGWRGTPTNSTFSERREVLTLTKDVSYIYLGLATGLSGGRFPDTLGMMVIDDVRISVITGKDESEEREIYKCDFETGTGLDRIDGTPSDWQRALRYHADMNQVVKAGPVFGNHALAVLDNSPNLITAWNCKVPGMLHLKSGDRLVVRWKEMFTVGAGGAQTVSYKNVPPGKHVFRVLSVTPLGKPDGHETALTLIVPKLPFWRTPQFVIGLIVTAVAMFLAEAAWLMRQRLKRQMERLKSQQAVELERARIARDIHDDLGTSLTRIAMLSESARETADSKNISTIAREMTLALDEIVWAVNPENDSLDGLATYLGGYAQELLSSAGLRCRLDLPVQLPDWRLTAETRHNVFLAFKEALNNVLKHSGADEVRVSLAVEPAHFVLSVEDNGRGLQSDSAGAETGKKIGGHGLPNMKSRMEKIGGKFSIVGNPSGGATASFTVPQNPPRHTA